MLSVELTVEILRALVWKDTWDPRLIAGLNALSILIVLPARLASTTSVEILAPALAELTQSVE